jgi:pyrimidine deaminase RibD-like protein
MAQLRDKLRTDARAFALQDLLAGQAARPLVRLPDDKVLVTLEPCESILCEARVP